MSNSKISVLPVDNGDSILIEHDGCVVVTDLNYRKDSQDDEEDCYDIGEDIRTACYEAHDEYRCDVFVLTHPDKDHLSGMDDLFYIGEPSDWKSGKSDILIEELWVSDYMTDSRRSGKESKLMFNEVARRKKLMGSSEGDKNGNRIKLLATDKPNTDIEGKLGENSLLEWLLLAPTLEEADIDPDDSSNDSSLVIRWNAKVSNTDNLVLLGGDAGVDVWERIWSENKSDTDAIEWQFLVAPHHCSRSSMARKNEDEKYEYSDDALNGLGEMKGSGFIASSSKKILDDDDNPPSYDAKKKYLDILHKSKNDGDKRFFCTANHKKGKPGPVVFKFTSSGIMTKIAGASSTVLSGNSLTSEASTYGQE